MNNIRYDLIPQNGIKEVGKVLTAKLEKYQENQWKRGMKWTEVLSSLKHHLTEFELGNDYNSEKLLHIAEVATNALILCDFYHIYPQGDDRTIGIMHKPIVACDLDDTILSFRESYEKRFGTKLSDYWNGDYNMSDNLKTLQKEKDFWVNLPVKHRPTFDIDYYVTARSIPDEWTQECIQKNNLPKAPIISVPWNVSKIDILKELKVNIFIDDKAETFKECHQNGIFCYLMDSETNRHLNVGHRRIYDLKLELK